MIQAPIIFKHFEDDVILHGPQGPRGLLGTLGPKEEIPSSSERDSIGSPRAAIVGRNLRTPVSSMWEFSKSGSGLGFRVYDPEKRRNSAS